MAKKKTTAVDDKIEIPAVSISVVRVPIKGIDGPLVVHNWSQKAIGEMLAKQMGKKMASKVAKDPEENYKATLYKSPEGEYGFPCCAFKDAMVRASKGIEGLDMITMRQLVFVVPDIHEDEEFTVKLTDGGEFKHRIETPLVKLKGKPTMRMDMVRLGGKTADIRFRGQFVGWSAVLTVRYLSDRILPEVVANLVNLAGNTVGVGEGRPEKSTDMGWGRFQVDFGKKA